MNKIIKIIVSGIMAMAVCYFAYFIYGILRYSHSSDWEAHKQYLWIFKDSVKSKIDTNLSYSYVKKRDTYNNFHYRRIYNVIIWEFKDLETAELKNMGTNQNVNLDNVKFNEGEVLNSKSDLEITIKYGFTFNGIMNANLDEYSKIERHFEGANYIGFYGTINQMSLSNKMGEHQIIFNYTYGKTPTVFLLYKGHNSFYLIMINSEKPFDEHIISILDLK